MTTVRIVIFAKAPLPGLAKTRLAPTLGADGAASLAGKLLQHCLEQALAADIGPIELCVTPTIQHPVWQEFPVPASIRWSEQGDGDLGQRLARATQRVTDSGEAILLIGTDCPDLSTQKLRAAARALSHHDACMIPVHDGGYALLGLNRHLPSLFADMPWSTAAVAQLTQERILEAGWSLEIMDSLHDIDEARDLHRLPAQWLQ
jgi:rSAM/selenodomain-associated transferase 1